MVNAEKLERARGQGLTIGWLPCNALCLKHTEAHFLPILTDFVMLMSRSDTYICTYVDVRDPINFYGQ